MLIHQAAAVRILDASIVKLMKPLVGIGREIVLDYLFVRKTTNKASEALISADFGSSKVFFNYILAFFKCVLYSN